MKINKFVLLLPVLFLKGLAYGLLTESSSINFGGGVDYSNDCTQIADNRACDESNMISDLQGTVRKRNGSKRMIDQAISSNPVTSLYRSYHSTATNVSKALLATSWDSIYVSTDLAQWNKVKGSLTPNLKYNFVTYKNKTIITAQSSTSVMMQYDIAQSSFGNLIQVDGTTNSVLIRGRYPLIANNYFIVGNCHDLTNGTTAYPSRIWYSILETPSSMTALRYIDYQTDDGEEITGIGQLFGKVNIFKPTSIGELSFSVLNLSVLGGDQTLTRIVNGYGLYAPNTLATNGLYYILGTREGLRLWDGSTKTRLEIDQESRLFSQPIQPLIDTLIKAGTYKNSAGYYYPRNQWYLFAYESPSAFPTGKNNSVMVYDFKINEWFPFKNWDASTFISLDGPSDLGQLLYADSNDGYIYYCDNDAQKNDARKEFVVDNMENSGTWARSTNDATHVKEGTSSLKVVTSATILNSSMTRMGLIDISYWPDKSNISKSDLLQFKVYASSIQNISSIRIDLEINDEAVTDFDTVFTSVSFSSAVFSGGNEGWTTISFKLSSFTILNEWTALSSELYPFANTLSYYGVRFNLVSIGSAAISVDDVRIIQSTERPLNAFRLSKQFNLGTLADKRFRQIFLNANKSGDSSMSLDIIKDFGTYTRTEYFPSIFLNDIFVTGYKGVEGVYKLSSLDFSLEDSTSTADRSAFSPRPLTVDGQYIYTGDQYNNRLLKIAVSSMSVFVSSYGTLGSGTTNFNGIYQISQNKENLYLVDIFNHRIKVHRKKDLTPIAVFGSLGTGATSFHLPTGIAVDETNVFVGNDGNYEIVKLTISTFGFVSSAKINVNNLGELTLAVDEKYLYDAYAVNTNSLNSFRDLILEKRLKSDLSVVIKTIVRPQVDIGQSTYTHVGDIAITDDFIYIPFTDDYLNLNGNYYLQKRLKSDFSLISEYKSTQRIYTVAANGLTAFDPARKVIFKDLLIDGHTIQFRFYEDQLDNSFGLINFGLIVLPQPVAER